LAFFVLNIRPHRRLFVEVSNMNRRRTSLILVLVGLLGAFAVAAAADILSQLGLKPQQARDELLSAIVTGRVNYFPVRDVMKKAPADVRATLVKGALEWARAAVETSEFAARYGGERDRQKPKPQRSFSDEMKQQQEEARKNIEEMKKRLPSMSPEMRKGMEETIRQVEAQQKAQESDPKLQAMMKQTAEQEDARRQQEYQQKVKDWEARYPADVHGMVAMRLQRFLTVSADVDYDAQLVQKGSLKQFADPRYEAKPDEWKVCYRAGKPVVDAARAFATSWLAALGTK
jgi:hypothetical protein